MRPWIKVLTYPCLILAAMFVVFCFIDRVNPAMEFLTSDLSKVLLLIFSLLTVASSILTLVYIRRRERRLERSRHH